MLKDLDPAEQKEYIEFIKESVKDGSYFEDAFDWYSFRYVSPICERTILFFIAAMGAFITYMLYIIIINSLPIVEQKPVMIRAKDTALYFPVIKSLKPKSKSEDIRTINEAVVKYIIEKYVEEREQYDFRKADVDDLNIKFTKIKNNSSVQEYRNFQALMSRSNPSSPILNFGKDVYRTINIDSFHFKRLEVENFVDKARDFMTIEIPTEAEIRYTETLSNGGKITNEKYLVKIIFKFGGIITDKKSTKNNLDFVVNEYKVYKVK